MKNFEHRRDRFEQFCRYDNPLINLAMQLPLPDFRPYCEARQIAPFHFFLFCLLSSVRKVDNFLYRIYEGQVIKIDTFFGSYPVINEDHNLNYAVFTMSEDLDEFIARSVHAGQVAKASRALINIGTELSERERKNNIFTTCLPWINMTAIEHPIFSYRQADIPLIAWGKMSEPAGPTLTLPFSVQAHHGFVDGYHVQQLADTLAATIAARIGQ